MARTVLRFSSYLASNGQVTALEYHWYRTLEQLRSRIRWTAAERVQFGAGSKLVRETEIRDFDVHLAV